MMSDEYWIRIVPGQWRWRWDLNPRKACAFTRFRGVRPRPLGDSTAAEPTRLASRGRWPGRKTRPASTGPSAPALGEELAEQGLAVLRQDSSHHLGAVVEPAIAQDVPERACRTRLRVDRPVNDP